jgi:hypothetical protein
MEQSFISLPWNVVRDSVQAKLVEKDGELYVLARSGARRDKEKAIRGRRLRKLVKRSQELRHQKLTRDQLLIKLGAAKKEAGPAVYRFMDTNKDDAVTPDTFSIRLNWQRLREARRREGSYILRSILTGSDPARLWALYVQLTEIGRRSRSSRTTWQYVRSIIKRTNGLKRISSSHSSLIACRSR